MPVLVFALLLLFLDNHSMPISQYNPTGSVKDRRKHSKSICVKERVQNVTRNEIEKAIKKMN